MRLGLAEKILKVQERLARDQRCFGQPERLQGLLGRPGPRGGVENARFPRTRVGLAYNYTPGSELVPELVAA